MVVLTEAMKEDMKRQPTFSLATASKDGTPNVVPVGMLMLQDDGAVWIVDNYMNKTRATLRENPRASFFVWTRETAGAYQMKGTVEVVSSGPDYEKAKAIAKAKRETLPAKNLLRMTVTEVYSVAPGPDAGKRLL